MLRGASRRASAARRRRLGGPRALVGRKLAGLRSGLADGVHLFGGLHGEEAAIAGERDELIAGPDHLERIGGHPAVNARDDAVTLARLDDLLLGLHDGGIRLIQTGL